MKNAFLTCICLFSSLFAVYPSVDASKNVGYQTFYYLMNSSPNLVLSPWSETALLGAIALGADGKTQKEITSFLQIKDLEMFSKDYKTLSSLFKKKNSSLTYKELNSLYIDQSFTLKKTFVHEIRNYFSTDVQTVNFSKSDSALASMNDQITRSTQGKITEAISPSSITENTKAVLINSLYFKSSFVHPFQTNLTSTLPFTNSDSSTSSVSMMRKKGPIFYLDDHDFHIIGLQLKSSHTDIDPLFCVFFPKSPTVMNPFETLYSKGDFLFSIRQLRIRTIDFSMPKFTLSVQIDLKNALQSIGIKSPFQFSANFSNMTSSSDLFISACSQTAYFSLNEFGIEAAASTQGQFSIRSSNKPSAELDIVVNRPFVYALVDRKTGALFFLGQYKEGIN